MHDLFYVQDTRNFVGNCMLWWRNDNCGYVCDILEAKIFTKGEAEHATKGIDHFRIWPKKYIDARINHTIDMQDCNINRAEG